MSGGHFELEWALGIGKVLITEEEIEERVSQLGREISSDYRGGVPTFVGVLKGGLVFLSDLIRKVDLKVELDLVGLSSYRGAAQSALTVTHDLASDVRGRDLILVEGIVDTGLTLSHILDRLRSENPSSLEVCALLDKQRARRLEVPLAYVGFRIPDLFVVGYGLDYEEHYRNLPYIAAFAPEAHSP